jgi:predicted RNA-binding protein
VGFDPCLVAIKDDMFNKYSEVSVEFQPEPIDGNHLTFYPCKVRECGVRLLHAKGENEMQRLDLIMPSSFCFYPLDRNELEPRFQAKRARKS